jgi:hypothetical protein
MESLEESDTASLDLSCESSIFDEEEENTNEIDSIEVENENIGVNPEILIIWQVQDFLKSYLYLPNGCIEIDRVFCDLHWKPYFINWSNYNDALLSFFKSDLRLTIYENTNEIDSIEVENENIGVNPYQFEPYDSDSSSSQTQDSNSDESDHDRLENTDW